MIRILSDHPPLKKIILVCLYNIHFISSSMENREKRDRRPNMLLKDYHCAGADVDTWMDTTDSGKMPPKKKFCSNLARIREFGSALPSYTNPLLSTNAPDRPLSEVLTNVNSVLNEGHSMDLFMSPSCSFRQEQSLRPDFQPSTDESANANDYNPPSPSLVARSTRELIKEVSKKMDEVSKKVNQFQILTVRKLDRILELLGDDMEMELSAAQTLDSLMECEMKMRELPYRSAVRRRLKQAVNGIAVSAMPLKLMRAVATDRVWGEYNNKKELNFKNSNLHDLLCDVLGKHMARENCSRAIRQALARLAYECGGKRKKDE